MDFDVWLAWKDERVVAIDAGFSAEAGVHRRRTLEQSPQDTVRELGIDPRPSPMWL